ncbi:MAG: GatB/YqeY domain-containing protein [bacterium]|nr:GatB/YqeY domain-containing protein [bacterium]
MLTKEKLAEDLKGALKNADQNTVGVLRFIMSAINNKEIEKRGRGDKPELSPEELMQIVMSEEKKRKDAIEMFEKGSRQDLADKEKEEMAIIQKYLPEQLTPEETKEAVTKILGQTTNKDFGLAMKEVMKELRGKADAKLINGIVKELTSK